MSMDYELHDKLDMYCQTYLDSGYDMQSARQEAAIKMLQEVHALITISCVVLSQKTEAANMVLQEVWQQIKSWRDKQ